MTTTREHTRAVPFFRGAALCAFLCASFLYAGGVQAQQPYDINTELELGALFTSGNTNNENIKFKGMFTWLRNAWEHRLALDGFRSSQEDELAAQRFYTVASTSYDISEAHFVLGRVAHEKDRFSGFDSQSDASISYGREYLRQREDMKWDLTLGTGIRMSRSEEDDYNEPIVRFATEYQWLLSENASFTQTVSVESGEESTISRSETAIESSIMANLSLKFAVNLRHQSEVPEDRENQDTEVSVTLLIRL